MLSNVYSAESWVERLRRCTTSTKSQARPMQRAFAGKPVKKVLVPSITADYNDLMNAVDIGDQLKALAGLDHRVCKGSWRVIAWSFLLETALTNSFILQKRGNPAWKPYTSQQAWRHKLLEELFKAFAKDGSSRKRFKSGDIFTAVSQHNHVNRGKRARCLACQGLQCGQLRSRSGRRPLVEASGNALTAPYTRFGCDKCDVALCNPGNCWYIYHSNITR